MNIFIWAQSKSDSNNSVIVETIKKEHEAKGDLVYVLSAEEASFDNDSISSYQSELKKADMVYLAYPIHWGSYPFMFKKSIDSILAYGFAYEYKDGLPVGLLSGKTAKIITTSGHPKEYYVDQLKAIHYLAEKTIINFVGIDSKGAVNVGGRTHGDINGLNLSEVITLINN